MDFSDEQMIWVLGIGVVVLIAMFSAVIIFQQLRIKKLSEPKYGFLGKPLVPAVITLIMLGGLGGGIYLINQDDSADFQADAGSASITVQNESCQLDRSSGTVNFTFDALVDVTEVQDELLPGDTIIITMQSNPGMPNASESETRRIVSDELPDVYRARFQFETESRTSENSVGIFAVLREADTGNNRVIGTYLEEHVCPQ